MQLRPVFMPIGNTLVEVVGPGAGEGNNSIVDFLNKRGVGVHHLAFSVDDMTAAVSHFGQLGLAVGMVPAPRPPDRARQCRIATRSTRRDGVPP